MGSYLFLFFEISKIMLLKDEKLYFRQLLVYWTHTAFKFQDFDINTRVGNINMLLFPELVFPLTKIIFGFSCIWTSCKNI